MLSRLAQIRCRSLLQSLESGQAGDSPARLILTQLRAMVQPRLQEDPVDEPQEGACPAAPTGAGYRALWLTHERVQTMSGPTSRPGRPRPSRRRARRSSSSCQTRTAGPRSRSTTPGSRSWALRGAPPAHAAPCSRAAHHWTHRRRAWLVRDVYEELLLDGLRPDWVTFEEAMWANMRSRRVADTLYFFNQMARRGMQPMVRQPANICYMQSLYAASSLHDQSRKPPKPVLQHFKVL